MTPLKHSDHIMRAKAGEWLLACDTVPGILMGGQAGKRIEYPVGTRFRVKFASGELIWCLDEQARTVTFGREDMHALERSSKVKETRRER